MYTSGRQPRRLTGLFLVFATIFGTSTISAQDNSFDGGVLGGIVGGIIAPNFPAARIRSCGLDAGQPCLRTDQITTLQSSLSVLGFDPGPVDGIIGPNTLQAVDQFRLLAGSSRKGFYPSQIEFNWVISVAEVLEGESQPSHEKIQSAARNYAMQGNTSSEDAFDYFDYGMDSIVREDSIAQLRYDFDNLETGSVNDLDSLVQLPYDSGVGSVIQVDSVE
ncbi:MAG: peptidoglycan-binding protein [Rhodobacter sp.]|jgi:peptidoglycan hydrolase-like protein with peptidoglycan-binding domain|nr:peptidoglycan-binding protein [Rhodobacter sp.]